MDRIEFSNRINLQGENFADTLLRFFNQEMLLYNMVDTIDDIRVINNDTNYISFELSYKNPIDASNLFNKLSTLENAILYGRQYNVSCELLSDRSLRIIILG